MAVVTVVDIFMYRRATTSDTIKWGEMTDRSQYVLILIAITFTSLMGLMGYARSGLREAWHIFGVMKDTSPDAFTPLLGEAVNMVAIIMVVFFAWLGLSSGSVCGVKSESRKRLIFWLGLWGEKRKQKGMLETDKLAFNLIVTEFREVFYNPNNTQFEREEPTFIAVSVTCRNHSHETLELQANPIQVIGPSQMLMKELPLEHVRYKLYGGQLRRAAQLNRLDKLDEPLPDASTLPGAILLSIVAGLQASERESIVSEMYQREASRYQLYYHSFAPASLPHGVATSWTQYYPYTVGPVQVMLQGRTVEEGLTFALPPPPPAPTLEAKSLASTEPSTEMIILLSACAFVLLSVAIARSF